MEPVAPARARGAEADEVRGGRLGLDHGGERRRVRGDDDVLGEAALQAEAGDAEARVLVGALEVACVEGRLGDPPRHASLRGVAHLARHDEPVGLVEQAAGGRVHDQRGHEVLEHGARPGDERRAPAHGRQGSTEVEPVLDRHVTLGDREEACRPGLRREQVVVAGVERAVGHPVPDREQLPGRVEEEPELRLREQIHGASGEGRQPAGDGDAGGPVACRIRGLHVEELAQRRERRGCGLPGAGAQGRPQQHQVTRMALDGPANAPGPRVELAADRVAALRGERGRDVGKGSRVRSELAPAGPPTRQASPGLAVSANGARASATWRRPTVCVRRPSPIAEAAWLVRSRASRMPASAAATGSGWSSIS